MKTDHKHTFIDKWNIVEEIHDKKFKGKIERYEDRRCTDPDCRIREVRKGFVFVYK